MNEWKPNAPQLKRAFNRTPEPEPPRQAVSKAELEMLERYRGRRTPELRLSMGGGMGATAHANANETVEKRIQYIRERLATQRERARKGLQLANF